MSDIGKAIIIIAALVFNAFIIGGAAFLIVKHNWSAWWMLAAVFACASISGGAKK